MIYLTGFGQLELSYCKTKIQDLVYYNFKSDWSTGPKKKAFLSIEWDQWKQLSPLFQFYWRFTTAPKMVMHKRYWWNRNEYTADFSYFLAIISAITAKCIGLFFIHYCMNKSVNGIWVPLDACFILSYANNEWNDYLKFYERLRAW